MNKMLSLTFVFVLGVILAQDDPNAQNKTSAVFFSDYIQDQAGKGELAGDEVLLDEESAFDIEEEEQEEDQPISPFSQLIGDEQYNCQTMPECETTSIRGEEMMLCSHVMACDDRIESDGLIYLIFNTFPVYFIIIFLIL